MGHSCKTFIVGVQSINLCQEFQKPILIYSLLEKRERKMISPITVSVIPRMELYMASRENVRAFFIRPLSAAFPDNTEKKRKFEF